MPTVTDIHQCGLINRWHAHAIMKDIVDPVDGHSARVAYLLMHFWPHTDRDTLWYALVHDSGEGLTGDLPGIDGRDPELNSMVVEHQVRRRRTLWPSLPIPSDRGYKRVKFCDILDRYLMVQLHRPGLLDTHEWVGTCAWLKSKAVELGVSHAFDI